MKSALILACLVISATAAPQKTAGLEREAGKKSDKLQFSPADAQQYTGQSTYGREQVVAAGQVIPQYYNAVAGQVVPQTVYAAGQVVPQAVYGVADQVAPAYYAAGANALPGVVNTVNQVYPYSSSIGKTTVTSTSQGGIPAGTVYEHQGTSHIGHLATASHVKKPGQLWNPATPQLFASPIAAPAVGSWPSNVAQASYYNGQVQYVNGQPVQFQNGQWYYTNGAQIPNQYSSVYTNLLNRPASILPSTSTTTLQNWANAGKTYVQQQPQSWSQSVVGVRPAQQDKWYTKTNTQQVIQPFYGQPQYSQIPASSSIKGVQAAAPRPDVDGEKADW